MLEQLADKIRALKAVVSAVEKQFGKGAVMTLGDDEEPEPVATIPSGSLALDLATGIGGYPRGRVVEIFGPESSGKTTLALTRSPRRRRGAVSPRSSTPSTRSTSGMRAASASRPKSCSSPSPTRANRRSTSPRCSSGRGAVDLVVIDSVAALTPKAELEGEMGDAHMGLQARLMSQALRKLTAASLPTRNDADVLQPAPAEDWRDLRLARDDDGRQRAQVLCVDALRRPAHRSGEGRRRAGRRAHAREGRQEQMCAAVHRGRIRNSLGRWASTR